MEFSIEDIAAVLAGCGDELDILNYLERQKNVLQQRIREDRDIVRSLNEIIANEKAAKQLLEGGNFSVEEKNVEPMLDRGHPHERQIQRVRRRLLAALQSRRSLRLRQTPVSLF